jgi:hypothetical protein
VSGKLGLGSLSTVPVREAREKAAECRRILHSGVDPIEQRKLKQAEQQLAASKSVTFDQCRDTFVAAHRAGWRNLKHANQWTNTLKTYVSPIFGNLPVSSVDVALVIRALEPIWASKPETASRVRGRIESILDWAKVRGYRKGENPARWRGHLDKLLPRRSKVRAVAHHAAMPYPEIAEFVSTLAAEKAFQRWLCNM